MWWPGRELNPRRQPFQGCALPPELPGHVFGYTFKFGAETCSLHAECRGRVEKRSFNTERVWNLTIITKVGACSMRIKIPYGGNLASEAGRIGRQSLSAGARQALVPLMKTRRPGITVSWRSCTTIKDCGMNGVKRKRFGQRMRLCSLPVVSSTRVDYCPPAIEPC
jgi:hypothetical protein